MDLLEVVLKVQATQSSIAASYLGNRRDLLELARRELVPGQAGNSGKELPLLQGWRRSLVGDALLDLLSERCSVRVDRQGPRIRVDAIESGAGDITAGDITA